MVQITAILTTAKVPNVIHIFLNTVFKHYGLPNTIVYDRDPKFTNNICKNLFCLFGIKITFSTAYYLQTDKQTEQINQILERIL